MIAKARSVAGVVVAGARGRLLPARIPFRFVGAAIVFHALAWVALLFSAGHWPGWRGGLGWPLAALHLITLGTLMATAIGVSLQLLPVATRQPVRAHGVAAALWWIYVPGVAVLTLGMGLARPIWLAVGAAAVLAGLAAYAILLARNLLGARGMPGVVLHGWGALAAGLLLAFSAAALVAQWLAMPLLARDTARALHLLGGAFGVMGLLAFGLSYILVPMFALAGAPDERRQVVSGAAATLAVGLASVAAFGVAPVALRLAAIATAALALTLHVQLMQRTLAAGMRRDLGRALLLMRLGWVALAVGLLIALAMVLGAPNDVLGRLFVIVVVVGWLLSFLLGALQRILPFLATMHAAKGQKRPPTPSALTLEWPLAVHVTCHLIAVALLCAAALLDSTALVAAGALVGFGGAIAFGIFAGVLMLRLHRAQRVSPAEHEFDLMQGSRTDGGVS